MKVNPGQDWPPSADELIKRLQALSNARRAARAPACTHVVMDRVSGQGLICHHCKREPAMGFVYVCREDVRQSELSDRHAQAPDVYGENLCEDIESFRRWQLRCELLKLGMSESVIKQAEQGHYTKSQLDKLMVQKVEMMQTIDDRGHFDDMEAVIARLDDSASNTDGTVTSRSTENVEPITCTFQACHTCRPYFRERMYLSFGAVFGDSVPPVTPSEASLLPTRDARVLREIGRRTSSSIDELASTLSDDDDATTHHLARISTETFKTTQTDLSVLRRIGHLRNRFYRQANRSSASIARNLHTHDLISDLRAAIQDVFKIRKNVNTSPVGDTTITLPYRRTGIARDPTAGTSGEPIAEFDLGSLRRVRRQKERVDLHNGRIDLRFETGPRWLARDPSRMGTHGPPIPPHIAKANRRAERLAKSNGQAHGPALATEHSLAPMNGHVHENISIAHANSHGHHTQTHESRKHHMKKTRTHTTGDSSNGSESDSADSMYSCVSEGSEVNVEGGVALTEEAVETHTPDILTTVPVDDDMLEDTVKQPRKEMQMPGAYGAFDGEAAGEAAVGAEKLAGESIMSQV